MTHVKLAVDTTLEHLIFGMGGVMTAMRHSDKFRVDTAANPQFGIRMNAPVEMGLAQKFSFLRDCNQAVHKAAADVPPGAGYTIDPTRNTADMQECFDKLCASRAKHRWYDTGHWRSVCLYAKFMGLRGWELAEAQQILDDYDYMAGRGDLETQMRAVVAAHAEPEPA